MTFNHLVIYDLRNGRRIQMREVPWGDIRIERLCAEARRLIAAREMQAQPA